MISQFYLAVIGRESEIRVFDRLNVIQEGQMRSMCGNEPQALDASGANNWILSSPRYDCQTLYPEDELLNYFQANRKIVDDIKSFRGRLQEVYATILVTKTRHEAFRGFSFDRALLSILSDMRCSLEIDFLERT